MKRVIALTLLLFLVFTYSSLLAQDTEESVEPGFFVMSYNKVQMGEVSKVNALFDSITVPILDELKGEGKLLGFGQLNHYWGDEWNVNVFYITEDHASFITFWDEFVKRIGEKHTDAFSNIASYFQAHKDNMYFIRHMK
ncbi:MAG: hypothetical protein KJN64_04260 [Ignavibacteria bacterium]|nr:hypothetical protein [Ignavibacteria bacterium]MBT8381163.1 hypothetical protein [Ignavibacteria bacterium]MBT8390416.1 hypothetical protein [Ignavibacteria bacterium]NNJ52313.1 hypothetical protein [Ignavibacteriaceae bacterium]NNL21661.1 hypothetical protein [Ignavibacteriaceae bacterium]